MPGTIQSDKEGRGNTRDKHSLPSWAWFSNSMKLLASLHPKPPYMVSFAQSISFIHPPGLSRPLHSPYPTKSGDIILWYPVISLVIWSMTLNFLVFTNTTEIVYLTYIFVISPGPSTVSEHKRHSRIFCLFMQMYVYICACAFTVYEYAYINTFVHVFMFLQVNRCMHMYSSMNTCMQCWVPECIHSHEYTCHVSIHSSGPSVTALTSWRPLEAGP